MERERRTSEIFGNVADRTGFGRFQVHAGSAAANGCRGRLRSRARSNATTHAALKGFNAAGGLPGDGRR